MTFQVKLSKTNLFDNLVQVRKTFAQLATTCFPSSPCICHSFGGNTHHIMILMMVAVMVVVMVVVSMVKYDDCVQAQNPQKQTCKPRSYANSKVVCPLGVL